MERLGDVRGRKLEADLRFGGGGKGRMEIAEAAIITAGCQNVIENVSDEKSFVVVKGQGGRGGG